MKHRIINYAKKLWNDEHFRSFLLTFVTDVLWDQSIGSIFGRLVSNPELAVVLAFAYSVFRTFIRVLREFYFPKKKPLEKQD